MKFFIMPLMLMCTLLNTSTLFAQNWFKKINNSSYLIHRTYFFPKAGSTKLDGDLWLGNGKQNSCTLAKKAAHVSILLNREHYQYLELDGKWLAKNFGLNYTCAEEIFKSKDNHNIYLVSYDLKNNSQWYFKALSNYNNVDLIKDDN